MAYVDGSKVAGGRAYHQHQGLKKYIRERDDYTCQLCGSEGWIVDHIEPWAISHNSYIDNLRCLCHQCNLATRRPRSNANPFTTIELWYDYLEAELGNITRHNLNSAYELTPENSE